MHKSTLISKGSEPCEKQDVYSSFIAALFTIAKNWKQPRYPSVDEWINKLLYTQTLEYYLALKRNKLTSHEKTTEKIYMHNY